MHYQNIVPRLAQQTSTLVVTVASIPMIKKMPTDQVSDVSAKKVRDKEITRQGGGMRSFLYQGDTSQISVRIFRLASRDVIHGRDGLSGMGLGCVCLMSSLSRHTNVMCVGLWRYWLSGIYSRH